MKKFERNITNDFNLKEEASKRLALTADEISNLSIEDIYDNIEILEANLQVSEKDLAALLANENITSLEDAVKKCKESLNLHLESLKPEDVPEEIVFSGLTKLAPAADKVTVIKTKNRCWYETTIDFNATQLAEIVNASPELVIYLVSKYLPKLTATELRSFRTVLINLSQSGVVVQKSETSVSKSATTKQLSFEDLDLFSY